jgi:hypothetical protein
VNESNEQRTTLILTDVRDEDGTMWRAVHLTTGGELIIEGHDLGPGVERVFGCSEYEFERSLSTTETSGLRELLGLSADDDLLAVIGQRFEFTPDLETFLKEHEIEGRFSNRIGD